jgi:hypothetical protein
VIEVICQNCRCEKFAEFQAASGWGKGLEREAPRGAYRATDSPNGVSTAVDRPSSVGPTHLIRPSSSMRDMNVVLGAALPVTPEAAILPVWLTVIVQTAGSSRARHHLRMVCVTRTLGLSSGAGCKELVKVQLLESMK